MRVLVLLVVLALGYVPDAFAQSTDGPLLLRPGDAIRITVLRHPELTGEFVITADGTLIHPLYRELPLAGIPMQEAERLVRDLLSRFDTRPEFVLDPLLQVAVIGEVRSPNVYALRPATTITQAVALAGGATERGRLDRVRLFRDGVEFTIDLSRPAEAMDVRSIQSGDQILVERRSSVFRDYIAPAGSVIGALAAVLNIVTR